MYVRVLTVCLLYCKIQGNFFFFNFIKIKYSVTTKEYILVIDGSVPPFVVHKKHSPNLSLPAL